MFSTVEDTRYVSLNSKHAVSKPTSDDYITSYMSNIDFHFRGLLIEEDDILYSHIDIANAQIPLSYYNINYACNTLKYTINGGSILTLSLTRSNYNFTSLIAELQTQFLSAGYVFSITFNKPTGKLTFSATVPFVFLYSNSTIFDTLGFSSLMNFTSTNNILIAEHPCSLFTIKKLKFCSNSLSTNSVSSYSGGANSVLGVIPVNALPFGIIQYNNSSGRRSLLKNTRVDSIDIQVMDENNRYINFNNSNWSITLAITTTRKVRDTQKDTSFSNMLKPILELIKNPNVFVPPDGIDNKLFTDDTDLDFFMYSHGIDI
jgi:hypothetical protein